MSHFLSVENCQVPFLKVNMFWPLIEFLPDLARYIMLQDLLNPSDTVLQCHNQLKHPKELYSVSEDIPAKTFEVTAYFLG